ncbi:MAG: cell wall-active antibiotics response protein [Bacteroidales bacterium]|jgi:predicted membrane protein|nr:cell wall-active antibiotics response protein [Bacteroidales bacterium]
MKSKHRKHGRKPHSGLVLALLLILVGGLSLLSTYSGWGNLKPIIFSWWMLLVIIGIIALASRAITTFLVFAGTGTFFLLPKIDTLVTAFDLPADFVSNYWGVLLIYLGLVALLHALVRHRHGFCRVYYNGCSYKEGGKYHWKTQNAEILNQYHTSKKNAKKWFNHSVAFGENKHIFLEPLFEGGEVNVAFGNSSVDLRKTDIAIGNTDIYINAAFGSCTLYVPQNWTITTEDSKVILGNIADKRIFLDAGDENNSLKTLNIAGGVFFGNLDIRN